MKDNNMNTKQDNAAEAMTMGRRRAELSRAIDRCHVLKHEGLDYNGFAYLRTALVFAASILREAVEMDEYWGGRDREGRTLAESLRGLIRFLKHSIRGKDEEFAEHGGPEAWDVSERDARAFRAIQERAQCAGECRAAWDAECAATRRAA